MALTSALCLGIVLFTAVRSSNAQGYEYALTHSKESSKAFYDSRSWDRERGYVLMPLGKFAIGNQVEHLLGSIALARALRRCLVLPDVSDVQRTFSNNQWIPFETLFNASHLDEHICTIDMNSFVRLAIDEGRWEASKRVAYFGRGFDALTEDWYTAHRIRFTSYHEEGVATLAAIAYRLRYGIDTFEVEPATKAELSPERLPVIAAGGSPDGIPVQLHAAKLQYFLRWQQWIVDESRAFSKDDALTRPYLGVHVRNAGDWEHACKVNGITHGADYCTASHPVPQNECMPTTASIANEVRLLAGYFKLKAVFVAVQKSHANLAFGTELLDSLRKQLGKDVTVLSPSFNVPWVDLNILGAADEDAAHEAQ